MSRGDDSIVPGGFHLRFSSDSIPYVDAGVGSSGSDEDLRRCRPPCPDSDDGTSLNNILDSDDGSSLNNILDSEDGVSLNNVLDSEDGAGLNNILDSEDGTSLNNILDALGSLDADSDSDVEGDRRVSSASLPRRRLRFPARSDQKHENVALAEREDMDYEPRCKQNNDYRPEKQEDEASRDRTRLGFQRPPETVTQPNQSDIHVEAKLRFKRLPNHSAGGISSETTLQLQGHSAKHELRPQRRPDSRLSHETQQTPGQVDLSSALNFTLPPPRPKVRHTNAAS